MTGLIDLALPCRLISLKVKVGPERDATTLEELAAKAILAGRTSVERLAELFGLPRRLLLDVVLSLWDKGFVSIDMESGVVGLSETAHKRLVSGESMRDAATEIEDRQFLFEPITGRVLGANEGYPNAPAGTLQAPLHHGIRESDLSADELLRAVQAAIRLERRQGFRKNVLEVGFGHPVLRPPAKLRWVPVPASVGIDPDTGRLLVTLTDTRKWDAQAATRMRQHMAALAEAEPKHPFVQSLRGQASQRLEPSENLKTLFDRFSDRIARLPEVPSAQLGAHQRDLNQISARLADRIASLDRARASVTVVNRTAGQLWAFEDLIGEARTQVLIAAPAIAYRALNLLLPALRAALDRRVQLVVLWGRTMADSLQDPVRAAFDELETRYRSFMLIADRSARLDACVVVQDGSRALVGSHSLLEVDPGRDSDMVSVLIEPTGERSAPPSAVTELLTWARGAYPYWQDGQRIIVPRTEAPTEAAGERDAPPEVPVLPEQADQAAVRLLADTWEEYRAALVDTLRKGDAVGPVVELVTDGENQEFLWHAIRGMRRRLIIADDNIDPALFSRLLGALHGRTGGGTVDLVFQSTAGKTPDGQRRERRPDITLHQRRAAARLVIADDEALIGSFSPLGDDGSRFGGVNGRRQLGVMIRSQSIATELARSAPVEMAADDKETDGNQPRRTRSAVTAALPMLVEARRERQHGRFGSFVAARLAELDQPWVVLDAWEEKKVPTEDLRPAVAAFVRQVAPSLRAAPAEHRHVLRWVSWLLTDAWQGGRFVAAAVIAGLVPSAEVTPSVSACLSVAPIELGPLGESLTEPLLHLSELDGSAASVGAAGALAELMLWGGPEGEQGLELLEDRLPPAWRELAAAAREFYTDTAGAPVPVPLITAELSRWDAVTQQECDWSDLAKRIDKLEQLRRRFTFESGLVMHDSLFGADGLLTRIRLAARAAPASRQLADKSLPQDIREYLNALVADAGAPPIQWHNQLHFLGDIVDIVRRARMLAATQQPKEAAGAAITSQACRNLAVRAAKAKGELLADANGLLVDGDGRPQPYGLPLRSLLERLGPLIQWGEM